MTKKKIIVWGLAGLTGAAAGLLVALRLRKEKTKTPPKTAPQLHIQNPGDQSEFPSAPDGERDLG